MLLSGHEGAVHAVRFSPSGKLLASGSHDKMIYLWEVYGECKNTHVFKGHAADVLDVAWTRDGNLLLSASADKMGAVFDVEAGERIKRLRGHSSFVNSVAVSQRGEPVAVTGSDDCTALVWDLRSRHPVQTFENEYQIVSVAISEDGQRVFTGGIDEEVKVYDVRTGKLTLSLEGHQDSITGIALSRDGSYILSNSMDQTLRGWDVRPLVFGTTRAVRQFSGHTHDFQKNLLRCSFSADGSRVGCGSADGFVNVWDWQTGRLLYKLPGHAGAVTDVAFHPHEPIVASASFDKKIYLGEIAPTAL